MTRTPLIFRTIQRPAFDDLDPFGHMNTTRFVSAFLHHRFTGLREVLGLDLAALAALPFVFVTRHLSVDFVKSIRGDEAFAITSRVVEVGEMDCEVSGEMQDSRGNVAATFLLRLTCVSKQTQRACPWGHGFMDRFFEATPPG